MMLDKFTRVFRNEELGGDVPPNAGGDATPVETPPVENVVDNPIDNPVDNPTDNPIETPPSPFYDTLPEEWRKEMVSTLGVEGKDFDKRMNQLQRVPDFKTLTKSYFEAQDKIREGIKPEGLPENATDEQLAEYREANGIPSEHSAYAESLEEGLVLGEADTRIMDEVFKVAHANNLPTEQVSQLTNAMLAGRAAEEDALVQQDGIDTQTTQRQLKEAWGSDFNTNINMIKGLTNQLPESVRDDFMNARLADGKALFNSPEVGMFLADIARKINPSGTVVPNSANPMQSMKDEIAKLEGKMGTDEWYKNQDMQKRYMDLQNAMSNQ